MKLLVIQTWHEIFIAVSSLLESSLSNPEGYLVPASQGRSGGLALTQEVIIANLLVGLAMNTITIAPTSCMFISIMCHAISPYVGCLWCGAGRVGFVFQL